MMEAQGRRISKGPVRKELAVLSRGTPAVLVVGWLALLPPARADHFTIELRAKAGENTKTAKTDTVVLGDKPKTRGILEARAGQDITVKWTLTCTAKKEEFKDVTVHFFVVKEEKTGQRAVPKLDKDVTAESALTMDFKPKDKSDGELTFKIETPGNYLLRLETLNGAGAEGHEHFAALDLVVK
jgi:hypothetical protein